MTLNPQVQFSKEGSCHLKRKRITLSSSGYHGSACAYTSIPAVFGLLLTLLKNPHFYHCRHSQQNATKEMMQELQGSSLPSWGFERLPGSCALSKRKFCSPEAIVDPLPICEHLNHNITGVTACVWQTALLIITTFIDINSEEFNCFQNSALQKIFPGVRAFSEMNKKDQSSLSCWSFLNYIFKLKSYFKK